MMAATARPVGVAVSMPSRKRATGSTLDKVGDGAGDVGDRAAEPVDGRDRDGVAGAGVVEHRSQAGGRFRRTGEFVGENPIVSTPAAVGATSCASRSWPMVLTRA